jgi:hypothetical protein
MGFRNDREALDAKVRAQEKEIEALREQVNDLRSSANAPRSRSEDRKGSTSTDSGHAPIGPIDVPDKKYRGYWRLRFGRELNGSDDEAHMPWWGVALVLLMVLMPFVPRGSCARAGCSSCMPREPLSSASPLDAQTDDVAHVANVDVVAGHDGEREVRR